MRRALLRLVPPAFCLLLAGCALPYYSQAARGQISLLRQRVPIAEVIEDPAYAASTREQLEQVITLRRFAVEQLALPDNDSYSSYVDLERDYVVWNVVAAAEYSVDPVTWCFPVAGCVAYRGYFRQSRAQAFAERLRQRGYDVFVGGSTAYSTLGHFDDPVLSTMLNRGATAIAATLFHELAHQRIYVKGDTEFSESLATALEQYAVEMWLTQMDDQGELERYRDGLVRQRQFAALVARQRDRLAELFAAEQDPALLAQDKEAAYVEMRSEYEILKTQWGGRGHYDGWFDDNLNNAVLVALTSYQRWVPGLRQRLDELGPAAFFADVEALLERDRVERNELLEVWNTSALAGSPED